MVHCVSENIKYVVAIALKINHFRNKEEYIYIFHDIVTTQINIDASFRTLWIHFHHPYMWHHFDVPRIQQATLTFITEAATESEVQPPTSKSSKLSAYVQTTSHYFHTYISTN